MASPPIFTVSNGTTASNVVPNRHLNYSGLIESGGTLNNLSGASLTVDSGGLLLNKGSLANYLGASLVADSGSVLSNFGSLTNSGVISNSGILDNTSGATITNFSGGQIDNRSGGLFVAQGASVINNYGTFNQLGRGDVVFAPPNGYYVSASAGYLSVQSGATFNNQSGGVLNNGSAGESFIAVSANIYGAIITVDGALNNANSAVINNRGFLNVGGDGSIHNYSGGTINNDGGFLGVGFYAQGGTSGSGTLVNARALPSIIMASCGTKAPR